MIELNNTLPFAQQCLFFTEGDFGSHIYVPPFLGKDVRAIAPCSVYALAARRSTIGTPMSFGLVAK